MIRRTTLALSIGAFLLTAAASCGSDDPAPTRSDPLELASGGAGGAMMPLLDCPSPEDYPNQVPTLERVPPAVLTSGPSLCSQIAAVGPCSPHHIYRPAGLEKEQLVVFLPGTNMEPDKHDIVTKAAAFAGYRTIGLSYDNTISVEEACDGSSSGCDDSCANGCRDGFREEVIFGDRNATCRDLLPEDAILVRLHRLLSRLHTEYPTEGWDAYFDPAGASIDGGDIRWERIIVAGFSQGAGQASWISKHFEVRGLVAIEGPTDTCDGSPNPWLTRLDASAGRPRFVVVHGRGEDPMPAADPWIALGAGAVTASMDGPDALTDPSDDIADMVPPLGIAYTNQAVFDDCSRHATVAKDGCLTTRIRGNTAADEASPEEARLFGPYVDRFCYAGAVSALPPAVPGPGSVPDVPTRLPDVHLVEEHPVTGDASFTRPMVPAVRTTADGRIGLDVRTLTRDVTFYLLGPENLGDRLLESPPGAGGIVIDTRVESADQLSNTTNTKHQTICDSEGMPYACGPGSDHDCYDFTVVSSVSEHDGFHLVSTDVTVAVSNPKTATAAIAAINYGAQTVGATLLADGPVKITQVLEPTITRDGRLIVFRIGRQTVPLDNMSVETDIVYATYDESMDPCDVTQWTQLHRISHAPHDPQMIGRYGIADQPFRDATGKVIPDGDDLHVTYPWIDRDGHNLFYESVGATLSYVDPFGVMRERYRTSCVPGIACVGKADEDVVIPTRGIGFVGRWSQGKMVLLDGAFNNIDFGLNRAVAQQRMLELYVPGSDVAGVHDGRVRAGTGRDNGANSAPPLSTTNTAVIDSLESAFAYRDAMKPQTVRDVVWLLNTGKASDEVAFDDYLDPRALIVSNMVGATEWVAGQPRLTYHDGFAQTGQLAGNGFTQPVLIQNAAAGTSLNVPTVGETIGNVRLEPVALGGIQGKGLWLDGPTTSLQYAMPANPPQDTLYAGIFVDARVPNDVEQRRLLTFPDGTHLVLLGRSDMQYLNAAGGVEVTIALPAPLERGWAHIAVVSRGYGQTVDLFVDGYRYHRWASPSAPMFTAPLGVFAVGAFGADPGVRGWIDELVVLAYDPGPEVACNHARGTLVGLGVGSDPAWLMRSQQYPPAAHAAVSAALPSAIQHPAYACFVNYKDPLAAHLGALPNGTTSVRDALLFPEGPLVYGAARPDSSANDFCLSCHHDAASSASLDLDALIPNSTPMELDPRRQPLQPAALLFGRVPASFLDGLPLQPIDAGAGWSVDQVLH